MEQGVQELRTGHRNHEAPEERKGRTWEEVRTIMRGFLRCSRRKEPECQERPETPQIDEGHGRTWEAG